MRIKPPVLADEDQTDEAELWFLPGPTGDGDGCRVWFPISIEAIS